MNELYRRLTEFTHDGVYRYTFDDGRILMANRGLTGILGFPGPPEELVGKRLREVIIYTEEEGRVRRELERTGEIHGFEYHFQTLAGENKWVVHDSFMVTDPETGRRVVDAIVRDVTVRRQAEQELAREKERLAVTLGSIGDAVIATDTRGVIQVINPVAEQLTGWGASEAVGRPLAELFRIINEQTRLRCEDPVTQVLRVGRPVGLANHTALIARDGTEHSIADSGAPIRDREGQVIGVVLVFRDVTERRRAEEALYQAHNELERRVQERTAELARSNAELEQYASVASHDLQEPLRMVTSYLQLLERRYRGKLDAEADEFIRYAVEGAARMRALINDLLEYSRVGRSGKPFVRTDCAAVVESVLANLAAAIQEAGAQVVTGAMPTVAADGGELAQLFQNLIGNAIKFRGEKPPEVRVEAVAQDHEWRFAVRDNGIGIEPQYSERIFQVFQRLHAREEYPGTGIGLAICKKIVEHHHGRIWVESAPGQGATFYFTLPADG